MKLTTNRKKLTAALQLAAAVAEKKQTMPILTNVLLVAQKGALAISATDLERAITIEVDADVTEPGETCLPAADLLARVRAMPGDEVTINGDDTVSAVGTKRRYKMHSTPADQFPKLPQPNGGKQFKIAGDELAKFIDATQAAVRPDISRQHINSLLFEGSRAVATDGHRMAIRGAVNDENGTSMLLPQNTLKALRELAAEDEVTFTHEAAWTFAEAGAARLALKTPQATFPPWRQVLPSSCAQTVTVDRAALADAIRAVAVASPDRTGGVRVTVADGEIRIDTESPETGEGSDAVAVDYSGPSATLGLNARYVLDALAACDTDEISLGFSGELDPVVVRGGDSTHVVMPLRI